MNRRDLFRIGISTAALPVAGLGQHHQHGAALAPAQVITGGDWKPRVFDEHQNKTVVTLSELIIPTTDTPGGKDAMVNRYLDLILADGPAEPLYEFLDGLAWLDGYAIRKHKAPFVSCSEPQQIALLTALDSGSEPGTEPGRKFFRSAKSWIAEIYYRTEIGMKELNKGVKVPPTWVGCEHSSHA